MKRYFYAGDDLDSLERLSVELEHNGLDRVQMHVLSQDDTGVDSHVGIHSVASIMKRDVIASGVRGALIGLVIAGLVLVVAWQMQAFATPVGTLIAWFLSIASFGFCTWEGGLFGIQTQNRNFSRFKGVLDSGRHIFFVDVRREQVQALRRAVENHPEIEVLGQSRGLPAWLVTSQREVPRFLRQTLP